MKKENIIYHFTIQKMHKILMYELFNKWHAA